MKSINEYALEKTGLTIKAQAYTEKMKKYFTYESCNLTKNGILFENVIMKEPIKVNGSEKDLKKGMSLHSLEIRKNGWLDICEEDTSYIVMKHNLQEAFFINDILPTTQEKGIQDFPVVTAIQLEFLASIQKVIEAIKKLSLEEVNHLKSILGTSLEEKIFRDIIDACLQDNPPKNGQQNGV